MIIDRNKISPLVSIVIPAYNRANLLKRAIESTINQTYKNLEIIIVDDGSSDNTEQIVQEYRDLRIQYIRNSKNRGASVARNIGIKSSRGDFIALLDSDDEYLPKKIEKSLQVFKNSPKNLGVVSSNFWKREGEKKNIGVSKRTPFIYFGVFRKEVFEKIGFFDEELEIYEDLDFCTRLVCKFPSYFINEPLAIYHFTEGSRSFGSNIKRLIEIKKLILERYAVDLKESKHRLALCEFARINYYLGKDFLSTGQAKEARKYFLKAFFAYPVKIEYLAKFLGTYLN